MNEPKWRTSSYSAQEGGQCVELAALNTVVGVRDSKNLAQGHLEVSRAELGKLVSRIKRD
ncbi:DUF397 domain-containing protein [Actinomadura harenae]|uniref:DUF397 domain-containing protein n=1 Tax=Actinomadura harenae TaxID=2483351 RepID=UPI0026BC892E|nr:DUF397 domain-containing protein [Actinomadura harenae]